MICSTPQRAARGVTTNGQKLMSAPSEPRCKRVCTGMLARAGPMFVCRHFELALARAWSTTRTRTRTRIRWRCCSAQDPDLFSARRCADLTLRAISGRGLSAAIDAMKLEQPLKGHVTWLCPLVGPCANGQTKGGLLTLLQNLRTKHRETLCLFDFRMRLD